MSRNLVALNNSNSSISVFCTDKQCTIIKDDVTTIVDLPRGSRCIDVKDDRVYINGKRIHLNNDVAETKKLTLWQHIKDYLTL